MQVLPFITTNLTRNGTPEDWHFREAAAFAFGAIMEGPSVSSLDGIVRQGMPFLLGGLKDPHRLCRVGHHAPLPESYHWS